MLKPYLQHQVERALRGEITNGLLHCHSQDLTSVVLHDEPGNRIRMFAAGKDNHLYRNQGDYAYALAIHAHHCDVRFVGIHGTAHNVHCAMVDDPTGKFQEHAYVSGITSGGPGTLTPTGRYGNPVTLGVKDMMTNPVMRADQMHTIRVPRFERAAWLVIEGAEDPAYQSVCWTNAKKVDMDGLYVPMTQHQIVTTLNNALHSIR